MKERIRHFFSNTSTRIIFLFIIFAGISFGIYTYYTSHRVVKLDVPYFRQEYANSCEAASTRMALAFHGVEATDMDILEKMGYEPRFFDAENNEWDDPQEMYVGYADIPNGGGYGVYGKPVAKAVEAFGRGAKYETNITPRFLAEQLALKNPIVIWGYTSLGNPYSWNTPDGGKATAFKGEHARVVVGFQGSINHPIGFFLHDPINGQKFEYWKTSKLMKHINSRPGITNQAVVVQ